MMEADEHSDLSYRVMCAIVGGTHLGIVFAAVSLEPSWPSTISLWLSSASIPLAALVYGVDKTEPRAHIRWPLILGASWALAISLSLLILSASTFAFVLFWVVGGAALAYIYNLPEEMRRQREKHEDRD